MHPLCFKNVRQGVARMHTHDLLVRKSAYAETYMPALGARPVFISAAAGLPIALPPDITPRLGNSSLMAEYILSPAIRLDITVAATTFLPVPNELVSSDLLNPLFPEGPITLEKVGQLAGAEDCGFLSVIYSALCLDVSYGSAWLRSIMFDDIRNGDVYVKIYNVNEMSPFDIQQSSVYNILKLKRARDISLTSSRSYLWLNILQQAYLIYNRRDAGELADICDPLSVMPRLLPRVQIFVFPASMFDLITQTLNIPGFVKAGIFGYVKCPCPDRGLYPGHSFAVCGTCKGGLLISNIQIGGNARCYLQRELPVGYSVALAVSRDHPNYLTFASIYPVLQKMS